MNLSPPGRQPSVPAAYATVASFFMLFTVHQLTSIEGIKLVRAIQ